MTLAEFEKWASLNGKVLLSMNFTSASSYKQLTLALPPITVELKTGVHLLNAYIDLQTNVDLSLSDPFFLIEEDFVANTRKETFKCV